MSNKKFFTLIRKDTIHQATEKKILPKEALSHLLSSEEVLETIQDDAETYQKEIVRECEIIKDVAQKEGFEEGYTEWVAHIKKLEDEIATVREDLQKLIVPLALKVAKKVVSTELSIAPQAIVDIVTSVLKSVAQHKRIVIYLNKQDLAIIESNRNEIKQLFESLESLSLRDREDVEAGGCIVETEGGIINARLQDRWRTIEAGMEALAHSLQKRS